MLRRGEQEIAKKTQRADQRHASVSARRRSHALYIFQLPKTPFAWKEISKTFETDWNVPHCVGALDEKHILLQAPVYSGSDLYNYKSNFSIVLLALVDGLVPASTDNLFVFVGNTDSRWIGPSGSPAAREPFVGRRYLRAKVFASICSDCSVRACIRTFTLQMQQWIPSCGIRSSFFGSSSVPGLEPLLHGPSLDLKLSKLNSDQ
ncbi:hypothetical protein PR048_028298 [Dryococelus australis]|uniref:DDE Tnp4 domain-containing protein n=1 Tax=Dryococelus australis TaxID=614101 RepID=A0ABQ9GIW8_9NEOP|nr:hypothetical protein PR048_028298 [Dryococelus australis]